MTEPRILFVACTPLQERPSTGVDQRMRILHDALTALGKVDFHQADPPAGDRAANRALGSVRDDATASAILHPWPALHARMAAGRKRFLRVGPRSYDVVFLHRLAAFWWTGWLDRARTIVDIDDIPSQIVADRMRRGARFLAPARSVKHAWARFNERRVIGHFRFNLVCSEADRIYLGHQRTVVVQNAFWRVDRGDEGDQRIEPHEMLFVGSLGYPPNAEGLGWFISTVLPRIRQVVPDARLTVIGQMPSRPGKLTWASAPGVSLVGAVADVDPYIRRCRFEVCPLLRGQGTRVKILEGLSFARPVVTTSIGSYGLDLGDEHGVLKRDDPAGFAEACIDLLQHYELRSGAAVAGQRHVLKHHSAAAVREQMRGLVETILSGRS